MPPTSYVELKSLDELDIDARRPRRRQGGIGGTWPCPRLAVIVRALADTGVRLGELLALRLDDVRLEGGKSVLKVQGKGDRERLVPIAPSLARRLRRFADGGRPDATSDRLFLTPRRGRESGQLDGLTESAVCRWSGAWELMRLLAADQR
jgi:integrase